MTLTIRFQFAQLSHRSLVGVDAPSEPAHIDNKQVQDRPAESLPYPQIGGADNVMLETEGPP